MFKLVLIDTWCTFRRCGCFEALVDKFVIRDADLDALLHLKAVAIDCALHHLNLISKRTTKHLVFILLVRGDKLKAFHLSKVDDFFVFGLFILVSDDGPQVS